MNTKIENKALKIIQEAYNDYILPIESFIENQDDQDEYVEILKDTKKSIAIIYDNVIKFGGSRSDSDIGYINADEIKTIRFVGKEYIENEIINLLKKDGYYYL